MHSSSRPLPTRLHPFGWGTAKFFLIIFAGLIASAPAAWAQVTSSVTALRSFDRTSGQQVNRPPVLGADGNLYGVTAVGGANGQGTLYRLTPDGILTVLHDFVYNTDGGSPDCSLLLASDGYFYGVANLGGPDLGGTVFRATKTGIVTVLHAFVISGTDAPDGKNPVGGVIQGSDGQLYGVAALGGPANVGTVFRLALDGTFTTLHAFDHSLSTSSYNPQSALVQGSDGNFYGVTPGGADAVSGTVYKVTPDGTVTTLHSFNGTDGHHPLGPLVESGSGAFYGTTMGGPNGEDPAGTVFEITAAGQLTTLRTFTSGDLVAAYPDQGLVRGTDGNLYGITYGGGVFHNGSVFQCTPAGNIVNVYSFNQNVVAIGYYPVGLVSAPDNSFYGTNLGGGTSNKGTVYRLTVSAHPPFFDGEVDLDSGVEYLAFPNENIFGYYAFLSDPHYLYHFDLGYEYVFDAGDGMDGVFLYDFTSNTFFYTSPTFPFPYLYDFNLKAFLYYYPDPNNPGRYNTNGTRYFYNFSTGKIITK